jgi:tRNA 5-methylaminomethyl-2-thiouridine biosynthesis bifunctional protein
MSDTLRPADIDWSQGVPLAREFGDVYFSRAGGPAETSHVFLKGNALSGRLAALGPQDAFTIVETGFGTGLNCLCTLDLWEQSGGQGWLHYVSVEKFPLAVDDLRRAHACWPGLAAIAAELQAHYPPPLPGFHRFVFPARRVSLTLFLGDVAEFLSRLDARADAWFLDGFAPGRNPGMWNEALYRAMAALSHPDTTLATFTAAGDVRRGLTAAGFAVEKVAGFGQKREMIRGRLAKSTTAPPLSRPWLARPRPVLEKREACVIGAGIAGAHTAHRLALRGWRVTVLERESVAAAGSGNPAAVVYGRLAAPGKAADHFSQQAWMMALGELARGDTDAWGWHPCGLLQLATGHQGRLARTLADAGLPAEVMQPLSSAQAGAVAGLPLDHPALFYPRAGWLEAGRYCRTLLAHPGISLREGVEVVTLERSDGGWRLLDDQGECLQEAPVVVVANAGAATRLAQLADLPLNTIRGQVSLVPASTLSQQLRVLLCHDGYLSPPLQGGFHCVGATFQPGSTDLALRAEDHTENRRLLAEALPALAASLPPVREWTGRVALRCQSPDYLPLVGPVAAREDFLERYAGLRDGRVMDYPPLPVLPGLYVNIAHGSKGFSHAMLAAEILASELGGEPAPVSTAVLEALHPMRFRARELRRSMAPAARNRST